MFLSVLFKCVQVPVPVVWKSFIEDRRMCIYIYIYIYIHIHIYIYIYITIYYYILLYNTIYMSRHAPHLRERAPRTSP